MAEKAIGAGIGRRLESMAKSFENPPGSRGLRYIDSLGFRQVERGSCQSPAGGREWRDEGLNRWADLVNTPSRPREGLIEFELQFG